MKCPKCSQYIPDDGRFCPACGIDVKTYNKTELKELKCKSCGGNMEIDYDHNVIVCPYCGATEVPVKNGRMLLKKPAAKEEPVPQPVKPEKKTIKVIIRLIALVVVFIVIIAILIGAASTYHNKHVRYDWPSSGLSSMIPQPSSEYGEIYYDYNDAFSMDVYKSTSDEYRSYVEDCIAYGFSVDARNDDSSYEAYNEEGYCLRVYFYSDDEMYINVQAPIRMNTINWSYIDAFALLPAPESDQGKIEWEYSDSAMVHVGNTTKEAYDAYVQACKEAGFDRDMVKGDDYYYAYHRDCDQYLSLSYEGFNTMRVDVSDYEGE